MYDVDDIKKYILFLKNECGLSVTLHVLKRESLIIPSELITFNIHDNSYCIYIKTFSNAHKHCMERQKLIGKKCADGSFCGNCYAGVREYVYPVKGRDGVVAFISVSGYMADGSDSYITRTANLYSIPEENLRELYYSSLKKEMPPKESIDTVVMPLCSMLELAYLRIEDKGSDGETLVDGVVRYLKQYHTKDITLEDICNHFSCSRSNISHSFKRETGKNLRDFLTDLRLEDAKSLLKYSNLTITEIAYSVGFSDSNYFSNVFKKKNGMSPLKYRKKR